MTWVLLRSGDRFADPGPAGVSEDVAFPMATRARKA